MGVRVGVRVPSFAVPLVVYVAAEKKRRHEACGPAAPDNCFVDWAPFQSNHLVSAEKKKKEKPSLFVDGLPPCVPLEGLLTLLT